LKIAIIGLGYVGCVSAACLASAGHQVVGVDISPVKVGLINQGRSPIIEKDIEALLGDSVSAGRLSATVDIASAIEHCEISMICVGTPSRNNGSLDLQYIRNSVAEVAHALRDRDAYHVVAIRSTMLPGTLETVVLPLLEKESGKSVGSDIGLCANPEFLREGTAVADYRRPPFTLVGAWDERSGALLAEVYKDVDGPLIQAEIRVTEMLKYSCNMFHALKVGFANEIGVLCKEMAIDSHQVMDIFKQDKELNISASYLTPGFAFGGSCLPKDLRAVMHKAKELDLTLPILSSILPSNQDHIERAYELVQATGSKKVGILGLSFKTGTDDLRESPIVQLAERLLGKGYELAIYDNNVTLANLLGANKQYIEQVIPHLAKLLNDNLDSVVGTSEVLVVGKSGAELVDLHTLVTDKHKIIDLVRLNDGVADSGAQYQGICW